MDLVNKKVWVLTDGSQGMISQVNGLAQYLNNNFSSIKTELRLPWSILQPGILPIYKWIFKNKINLDEKPEIIISCGRKSVYLSIFLKKIFLNKIITIHIQNPKININKFDYIIAPNHDKLNGKNVIRSIGALHMFTKEKIEKEETIHNLPNNNLITILIGGKNRHYEFNKKNIAELIENLKKLKKKYSKINLLIICSRRTDKFILDILSSELSGIAFIWNKIDKNPYIYSLKYSDYFVVTSDSTSMISECAYTGKPIYVYHLPYKRKSYRIDNFHKDFENRNITKKFSNNVELKLWYYEKLDEAKRISGIIKERIIEGIDESR